MSPTFQNCHQLGQYHCYSTVAFIVYLSECSIRKNLSLNWHLAVSNWIIRFDFARNPFHRTISNRAFLALLLNIMKNHDYLQFHVNSKVLITFCRYYAFNPYRRKRHLVAENHNFWAKNHIIYCEVNSRWILVIIIPIFYGGPRHKTDPCEKFLRCIRPVLELELFKLV